MNELNNINAFTGIDSGMLKAYGFMTMLISILVIAELWIIFNKCGKKGWLSIIPIANVWTLFTIVDLPGWLSLIPVANIVGLIVAYFKLPVKFNKSAAYGIGIIFLPFIFLGLLAFSKEKEEKTEIPSMDVPETPETNSAIEEPSSTLENNNINPSEETNSNNEVIPDLMASPSIEEKTINIENNNNNSVVEENVLTGIEEPAETITQPLVEEQPIEPIVEESNIPSAFEMTPPMQDNQTINDINTITEEKPKNNNEVAIDKIDTNIDVPINNDEVPNIFDELTTEEKIVPNDKPLTEEELEATFELPKMANEIINSDIKETKTCSSCGHINEYPNKTCVVCGTPLE